MFPGYEDVFYRYRDGKYKRTLRFEGKSICGKRGGKSNMHASEVKADEITGLCPEGMIPCSDFTSPKNTYCHYLQENRSEVCPITKLNFQKKGTVAEASVTVREW